MHLTPFVAPFVVDQRFGGALNVNAVNAVYMEHVRELDILGLVLDPVMDPDLVTRYALHEHASLLQGPAARSFIAEQPDQSIETGRFPRLVTATRFKSSHRRHLEITA